MASKCLWRIAEGMIQEGCWSVFPRAVHLSAQSWDLWVFKNMNPVDVCRGLAGRIQATHALWGSGPKLFFSRVEFLLGNEAMN